MITCYLNSCKNINRNTVKDQHNLLMFLQQMINLKDRLSEEQMQSVDHLMSIHLNTVKMNLAVKIF